MGSKLKYNFQSVGDPQEILKKIEDRRKQQSHNGTPVGIKTPMRISENFGDLLEMNHDQLDAIKDNLRNLILTNHGERLGHYDFGANLIAIVNELGSEDGDAAAMGLIAQTVSKYMPFISLEGFEVNTKPIGGNPTAIITLTYFVPVLDPKRERIQGIEVILSFDG